MGTPTSFEPWQGTLPEFVQRVAATLRRDSGGEGYLGSLLSIWLGFRVFSTDIDEDFFDVQVADVDVGKLLVALGGTVRDDVRTFPRLRIVRVPLDRARHHVTIESR